MAAEDAEVAEIEFGVSNIFGFFAHFAAKRNRKSPFRAFRVFRGWFKPPRTRAAVGRASQRVPPYI